MRHIGNGSLYIMDPSSFLWGLLFYDIWNPIEYEPLGPNYMVGVHIL